MRCAIPSPGTSSVNSAAPTVTKQTIDAMISRRGWWSTAAGIAEAIAFPAVLADTRGGDCARRKRARKPHVPRLEKQGVALGQEGDARDEGADLVGAERSFLRHDLVDVLDGRQVEELPRLRLERRALGAVDGDELDHLGRDDGGDPDLDGRVGEAAGADLVRDAAVAEDRVGAEKKQRAVVESGHAAIVVDELDRKAGRGEFLAERSAFLVRRRNRADEARRRP